VGSLSKGSSHTASAVTAPAPEVVVAFSSEQATHIIETVNKLDSSRWFLAPADPNLPLYTARVSHPMDFQTIREKIKKRKYQTADQFALDMRRVFGNCLKYNFSIADPEPDIRDSSKTVCADAKACLFKFEQEWSKLYGRSCAPVSKCSVTLFRFSKSPW
jgi:hypothetical protein